ncbi:MAG: hypothetical protein LIO81_12140 [Clostridiales bacterium]|nr:hypothetical protein [Clostridiales bacterium]
MQQPFAVGQAFWGKIRFPDGKFPDYDRSYLVVGVSEEHIEILTVSSVAGKEWKLTIPTNMEIIKFDPPFPKRTFVKLDSLQKVRVSDLSNVRIGRGGRTLDPTEFSKIVNAIKR